MSSDSTVFSDEYIESIASDLLGDTYLDKDKSRKAKNRAKYKIKKNPVLKELVMNTIEAWEFENEQMLGGYEVEEIMFEAFRANFEEVSCRN